MRSWGTQRRPGVAAAVAVAAVLLMTEGRLSAQNAGGAAAAPAAAADPTARGKRFVEAANEANAGSAAVTAYVMIDLPPLQPSADQRRIAIEFAGISATALATFYTEVCQREAPALGRDCAARRITIGTSEHLPPGEACRIVEGALVAVCAPSP